MVQIMAWHRPGDNAGIVMLSPLGTNLNELKIGIHIFSLKKCRLQIAAILSQCANAHCDVTYNTEAIFLRQITVIEIVCESSPTILLPFILKVIIIKCLILWD